MPVPGWHHLVQIFGINADHQPSLIVAMPMFPIFNFLVWRQMFLQAQLFFFADAKRHGKGDAKPSVSKKQTNPNTKIWARVSVRAKMSLICKSTCSTWNFPFHHHHHHHVMKITMTILDHHDDHHRNHFS